MLCRLNDFFAEKLLRWRHQRFDTGRITTTSVPVPIISVGSISIGGSGKTPAILALLYLLQQEKIAPAVLSRGYRRKIKGARLIPTMGAMHQLAADYGDEPLLFRYHFPEIPLAVAEKRIEGARLLLPVKPEIILLDDGFQHRFLQRDLDILVFKKEFAGSSARYFPCGELRDALFRLEAASLILLEKSASPELRGFLKQFAPIFDYEMVPQPPDSSLLKEPIAAFCGVASPKRFFETVKELGVLVADEIAFRDHTVYSPKILTRLQSLNARTYITTEKDFVKLPPYFLNQNYVQPIRWEMRISDSHKLLEKIKVVLNKYYIE